MRYVLGLDLGPTSIGWAALRLTGDDEFSGFMSLPDGETAFPAIGVRHFQINIDKYGSGDSEETHASQRRKSRLQRRTLRRKKARRLRLLRLLQENGLAPSDESELKRLIQKDPYDLRAKATKEKLHPHLIGRVLLHIAKRRGFRSNRKQAEHVKQGAHKRDIARFEEARTKFKSELKGRTPGEFWHDEREQQPFEPIRNREGQYRAVAEREQYADEIRRIWAMQELPTDLLERILQDQGQDDKDKLLFWQQDYRLSKRKRKRVIGKCSLMPGRLRCPYSNRKAQEFRMLQKVNDLSLRQDGNETPLTRLAEKRDLLIGELSLERWMEFDDVRRKLRVHGSFNLEWKGNRRLPGNAVDCELRKLFGKDQVKRLPVDEREQVWGEILSYLDDEEFSDSAFADRMKRDHGLELDDLNKLNKVQVPTGHVAFCEEVLDRLLRLMRTGTPLHEAKEEVCRELNLEAAGEARDELPIPDREHGVEITNPAVSNALHEVRRVVNSLIKELGKPERIVIELAREMKASKEHREEISAAQTRNQDERAKARMRIAEHMQCGGETVADWQVERYRLWQQQKCRSPYSGDCISLTQLFGPEVQVDHILPLSISLDNSLSNKVVCFSKENNDKKQRAPIDWLETDPERWERVQRAIAHWNPKNKRGDGLSQCLDIDESVKVRANAEKWERFFVRTHEIQEKYQPGNLLSDTMHITTAVREYLQSLYPSREAEERVATTKGGITAELRKIWGLNAILGTGDKKNRSDLRHHAIDAAVVTVTGSKQVTRVTKAMQDAWPEKRYGRIKAPKPWTSFAEDLDACIRELRVSHKVDHDVSGALLDEQPFGLAKPVKDAMKKALAGIDENRRSLARELVLGIETVDNGKRKTVRMTRVSRNAWLCSTTLPYLRRRPLTKAIKTVQDIDSIPIEAKRLRAAIEEKLQENGIGLTDKKAAIPPSVLDSLTLQDFHARKIPVKRIQTIEKMGNMIIITDQAGDPYKAYPSVKNHHHIEVFQHKVRGKCQYVCRLWTRIEVTQRAARREPVIVHTHPEHPDARFVMSLAKGDTVMVKDQEGKDVLAKVEGISQGLLGRPRSIDLELLPVELADKEFLKIPGQKDTTKKLRNEFRRQWRITSLTDIAKRNIRKVTVDPLGRVRWAEKKYWDQGAVVAPPIQ